MRSPELLLAFDGALAVLAIVTNAQGRTIPALSMLAALVLLGLWQLVLFTTTRRAAATFQVEPFFTKTHAVQALLLAMIHGYLGLYWPRIADFAPLLAAQILVGYLCDMLLAWSCRRAWRMSLEALTIVLTMNLFLWFREDYFHVQIAMIALAFFGREFLTWNSDGGRRRIFNSAALPLSVVSFFLLATGTAGMTSGADLVGAFGLCPNAYEVVFLAGLVTQVLYRTTPVSLGACLALFGLSLLSRPVLGDDLSSAPIQIQAFLALSLLMTNPETSPKSSFGRFLFGVTYGAGVFMSIILLRSARQPAFFDALLVAPVMNLLVPFFDRVSGPVDRLAEKNFGGSAQTIGRYGWGTAYLALFAVMLPHVKVFETRPTTILPPPVLQMSDEMRRLMLNHVACRAAHPDAYQPFGLYYEFTHLAEIRRMQQGLPAGNSPRPDRSR
jgi:hypothetical protein